MTTQVQRGAETREESGFSGRSAAPAAGPSVPEASPAQVHDWLQRGEAVLIDVREPDEHARERIKGASLLPLSRFDARSAMAAAKPGQRTVFHCRSGRRSADAVRLAAASPLAHQTVLSMQGGIEEWKKCGLSVETNASVARIGVMRQVQIVIGVGVLAGTLLGWLVHPAFLLLSAFFGTGLIFAGATGTCGLAAVLARMPWNRPTAPR